MGWLSKMIGKEKLPQDDPLLVVPIPPLITLPQHLEAEKGGSLTEDEVLAVRDGAICMTMRRSQAKQLAHQRGLADIDPENVWEEWVRFRT